MIVKLMGISLINVNGRDSRYLTFEIVESQKEHIALSPELKNLANMIGMNENTLTGLFQNLQQLQQQKYNFSMIIYADEYIDLGINFTVGQLYEFTFENGTIKIKNVE